MNLRRGLHRIAIFTIISISLLYFVGIGLSDWSRYQYALNKVNSTWRFIPRELQPKKPTELVLEKDFAITTPATTWSFSAFKYEDAIEEGYSDQEIVSYFCKKYTTSFDIEIFKKEAKTIKTQKFLYDISKTFFYTLLFAVIAYGIIWILYLCTRWMYKGFKRQNAV